MSLERMPEIPILRIASFLDPEDLLSFSHTNKYLYNIISNCSDLWRTALENSDVESYDEIREVATDLVGSSASSVTNVDKLTYLMHRSTKKRWKRGDFSLVAELPKEKQWHGQSSKQIVGFVLKTLLLNSNFLPHKFVVYYVTKLFTPSLEVVNEWIVVLYVLYV